MNNQGGTRESEFLGSTKKSNVFFFFKIALKKCVFSLFWKGVYFQKIGEKVNCEQSEQPEKRGIPDEEKTNFLIREPIKGRKLVIPALLTRFEESSLKV